MAIRSSRSLRITAALSILFGAAAIIGPVATAGASTGCGEYSFGFEGTRLLNDGISNSAGPFNIELPAGTYTVTTESFDDHAAHPGQLDQTAEQWYIVLDSGYVSPATSDIAEEASFVSDTFENQVTEAATSITLQHLGEGGVNSVSPLCVGFTTVSVPVVEEAVVEEAVVEEAVVEEQAPAREVVTPEQEVIAEEESVEAALPIEVIVEEEVVETAVAGVQIVAAAEVVEPVAAVAAAPAADRAQLVEPELALTGPSSQTWTIVAGGLVSLVAGAALLLEERRRLA